MTIGNVVQKWEHSPHAVCDDEFGAWIAIFPDREAAEQYAARLTRTVRVIRVGKVVAHDYTPAKKTGKSDGG